MLIRPNIGRLEHSLFADEARMEPLALGVIAALTPDDIDVVIVDDRIETIPYDDATDLVGISVETYTARRAYEIADEYRARGVRVILGGIHVSLIPEEAALHADSIFIGDAVFLWDEVISDLRHGAIKTEYRSRPGAPFYGPVRRDVFSRDYLPLALIEFARGCRHRCEYCAVSAVNGGKEFCRGVAETIADVRAVNKRYLFFVDDNIISDTAQAKRLFLALKPLMIRWVSQATISMTEDDALMQLMAESGCLGNVIGFESISEASISGMGKSVNRAVADNYRSAISSLRRYGLQTWAAFTIGHDTDTLDAIERTLDFAIHNRFTFAAFNILMPYPGTPLYARLAAEGRLLYDGKWWLHPEYRFNYAAFKPRHMTADALTAAGLHCRKRFNSLSSIAYRAFDVRTNMRSLLRFGLYLAYNPLFRKETFKKHGMRFGSR